MKKYRIVLADDHSMMRDGIKMLLSKNNDVDVVGEASNGQQAIQLYKLEKPDLMIMDISMPDVNGMEASQAILSFDPEAKIIVLSMYNDDEYISQCMEAGVMGYVVKNETASELDYAVRTVLKGQTYFSSLVQQTIFRQYSARLSGKKQVSPDLKLTTREVEIVRLIAEGLTSHEMADKLFISPRTVETHRSNLLKKVGVKNSIELVKKIERLGLV